MSVRGRVFSPFLPSIVEPPLPIRGVEKAAAGFFSVSSRAPLRAFLLLCRFFCPVIPIRKRSSLAEPKRRELMTHLASKTERKVFFWLSGAIASMGGSVDVGVFFFPSANTPFFPIK